MTLGWQLFFDIGKKKNTSKNIQNKLNFIPVKNVCAAKDIIKEIQRKSTGYEKILVNHMSDKGLTYRIYEEYL